MAIKQGQGPPQVVLKRVLSKLEIYRKYLYIGTGSRSGLHEYELNEFPKNLDLRKVPEKPGRKAEFCVNRIQIG